MPFRPLQSESDTWQVRGGVLYHGALTLSFLRCARVFHPISLPGGSVSSPVDSGLQKAQVHDKDILLSDLKYRMYRGT